ncbi:hypothetical protein, partial [Mycobacterium tuberculosis]|uniref:hypothetical protein n=1 Tax=Mycobacterium tuberculosis TaxID=1773 RepID=UPI001BE057AA
DGEEIKEIILRQNINEMKEAIQKLSGLEIYKALRKDLVEALEFLKGRITSANNNKSLEIDHSAVEKELDELNKQLEEVETKQDKEMSKKEKVMKQIQELKKSRENKIKLNSSSREVFVKKLAASETRLQGLEAAFIKEFSDSAFDILLKDQFVLLQEELKKEEKYRQRKLIKEASLVPYNNFVSSLLNAELEPPLTITQKTSLYQTGEQIWAELNQLNTELEDIEILHDLSNEQYRK